MSLFASIALSVLVFLIGFSLGAWAASALLVAKRFTFKNHYDVKHAVFTLPTAKTLSLHGLDMETVAMEKTGLFDNCNTHTKN